MFVKTSVISLIVILIILVFTSSEYNKLSTNWNRKSMVQKYGLYFYTVNDTLRVLLPSVNPDSDYEKAYLDFKEYFSNKKKSGNNQYSGMFEGKNVLFIHAESIQNFLIGLEVNGVEITPTFNKLVKEGMYFSKFYPQISIGTSSDTEYTLSTGFLPSNNGTVFVNYFDRTYDTIQKSFKKKGYYVFSAHANEGSYWNRSVMYNSLGYDKFYDKEYFEINEDNIVGLGLSDESFFSQLIPIIKEIKSDNSKYMGTVITLSNHSPFNDLDNYLDIDLGYLEDSEMGNYLKSSHYADYALGLFIDMLKEEGLIDNTVLVIYGDHEARLSKSSFNLLYNYDEELDGIRDKEDPLYISLDNYRYELLKNTPLIIWNGNSNLSVEINDYMGMWDVYPTLANMFNLEYTYSLGNDVFSDNEKIIVFSNGDIITNKIYYNNFNEEYISLSNEAIDIEYVDRMKDYANKALELSKNLLVYDLLNERIANEKGFK